MNPFKRADAGEGVERSRSASPRDAPKPPRSLRCSLSFVFPFAEKKSVVKAIAVHARVAARKNQSHEEAFEVAATAMTVNFKAATTRALTDW